MDNGYTGFGGQKLAPDTRELPLDRVANNADRVERLAGLVEQFADRFFSGCRSVGGESDEPCRPVPSGYHGQIERLAEGVDRLDKAIQRLSDIG